MKIIGRKRECHEIERCVLSKRPEFVVVYGRRRVGKTYLIKEFFNRQFAFYATGVTGEKTAGQLRAFHTSLKEYGDTEKTIELLFFWTSYHGWIRPGLTLRVPWIFSGTLRKSE